MSSKRTLCSWSLPENKNQCQLRLYNSLTRTKELFVPQQGKHVSWYSCGPTVYDTSHMGHARSYISFDILRRVMKDYFNYDVTYCMNITDIDDKIIRRARQTKLYEDFRNGQCNSEELMATVASALERYSTKMATEKDNDKKSMQMNIVDKAEKARDELKNSISKDGVTDTTKNLLDGLKDPLSEWLDEKYGAQVTDNSVFFDLPARFEKEYFSDMQQLNVLPPDVLTRVTEYVPEIIEYIQRIIDNGFAYEVNGSVYFLTNKFNEDERHFYAKLVPEAFGDAAALEDGEGDLTATSDRLGEKRNATDFALWKLSKPGEPSWDSPWGKGRPGWHIECSVMASQVLGDSIDIHTGGYDLKFPHHDNELAQAEAHYGHSHWVRYFLHSGHLTINGQKMSKSLKNFTTIREALHTYSSRQIRFAFLLHSWKDTLDYSPNTMDIALLYERTFKEFFLNVKSLLRVQGTYQVDRQQKWSDVELNLQRQLCECKEAVHVALCDSVDTRTALEHMRELVSTTNIYIKDKQTARLAHDRSLLSSIALYLTNMLKVFGVIEADETIGFRQSTQLASLSQQNIMPYLDCIADFRQAVRLNAAEAKDKKTLELCDSLRDDVLPMLGVRMEDLDGDKTAIKLDDKDTLMKEREDKLKQRERDLKEKEAKKASREAEMNAKEAQRKVDPATMFLSETSKYSQFDDRGIPTHAADGTPVSKSQLKKLQKIYDAQAKRYAEYRKSLEN